jgi:Na+-driven multidrug efflux pump
MMFPMKLGMVGAAAATAVSQVGAAGVYAWRLWRRKLLPQATDSELPPGSAGKIIKTEIESGDPFMDRQRSLTTETLSNSMNF